MFRKLNAIILLIMVISGFASVYAQSGGSEDDPARIISPTRGFQPAHSYALSDIESIDVGTGALSLHIQ